ncbi:6961_t:CDS:2 [Cetraspora pellucida]|uniref:6961_t:CDS:1 n=1 Tax=Cetraspora pellucida TaxID=1433469 RepID=A0ACA9LA90_9GLOM|nr:6961_t:CDS:2 [Cetraspora pellucida]
MQRVHESEERSGHTPPPPYTLVDQFTDGSTTQTQHSQNPYSENSPDSDFRLAQKLQDEEYVRWAESNRQQDLVSNVGESSVDHFHSRIVPPIPENYRCNHHIPYQSNLTQNPQPQQQYPIIYASPNQPPLPYNHPDSYISNGVGGNLQYYGSLNQDRTAYYQLPRPYPYYNNYQTTQPQTSYHTIDDDDNTASGCLTGLYERFISVILILIVIGFVSVFVNG